MTVNHDVAGSSPAGGAKTKNEVSPIWTDFIFGFMLGTPEIKERNGKNIRISESALDQGLTSTYIDAYLTRFISSFFAASVMRKNLKSISAGWIRAGGTWIFA